ncbi:unnamed protein product [Closterium sp. NIES-54]
MLARVSRTLACTSPVLPTPAARQPTRRLPAHTSPRASPHQPTAAHQPTPAAHQPTTACAAHANCRTLHSSQVKVYPSLPPLSSACGSALSSTVAVPLIPLAMATEFVLRLDAEGLAINFAAWLPYIKLHMQSPLRGDVPLNAHVLASLVARHLNRGLTRPPSPYPPPHPSPVATPAAPPAAKTATPPVNRCPTRCPTCYLPLYLLEAAPHVTHHPTSCPTHCPTCKPPPHLLAPPGNPNLPPPFPPARYLTPFVVGLGATSRTAQLSFTLDSGASSCFFRLSDPPLGRLGPVLGPRPMLELLFLIVVDEFSLYITVFPLCQNADVLDVLVLWLLVRGGAQGLRGPNYTRTETFSPLLFLTPVPPPIAPVAPPPSSCPAPSCVLHVTPQSSPPERPDPVVSGGAGGAAAEGEGTGAAGAGGAGSGGAGGMGVEATPLKDTAASRRRPCPASPPGFPSVRSSLLVRLCGRTLRSLGVCLWEVLKALGVSLGGSGFGGAGAGGTSTSAPTPRTVRVLTREQRLLRPLAPPPLHCPASTRPACCAAMASLHVLTFDHEGRPIQFDTWLFLAPGPPPVAVNSSAAPGAAYGDAASGGAEPRGAEPGSVEPRGAESEGARSGGAELGGEGSEGAGSGGAEPLGAEPGGAESARVVPGGTASGGAESRGTDSSGGPAGAPPRLSPRPEPLSPQQLREWFAQRTRLQSGATGAGDSVAGDSGAGGAGVTAGAGGAAAARTGGTIAAGTGGVGGARAGDPTEHGAAGAGGARAVGARAGGTGAGGAGAGGAGAVDPRAVGAGAGGTGAGGARAGGAGAVDPGAEASPLPAPSPYTEQTGGLTERREPASHPASPVRTGRRVPRPRPPSVPGTHTMTLRPSSVQLCVPLSPPPESSLPVVTDPESDRARAASPTVSSPCHCCH